MKAAQFSGPKKIVLREFDTEDPGPGWVRLRITATGICGTDLHLLGGRLAPNEGIRPGHEVAGIVETIGDGVSIEPGTSVAVEPLHACGACSHCNSGFPNRCGNSRLFGISAPGGLAELLTVPESTLHSYPADLDHNVVALSEPMAVCFRGVRLGEVDSGDRVAVLGSGTIGLLSVLTAKDAGASEVFATARYPHQAELARALGATEVFPNGEAMVKEIGDQLVEVVIETVGGTADTLAEASSIARPGGRVVILGVFEGAPALPALNITARELTMVGSNCYAKDGRVGDFGLATEQVVDHSELLKELVTHRFPLDQVGAAFAAAGDKSAGTIKVQVMPAGV